MLCVLIDSCIPFAICSLLQDRKLEILDGNLINLLLPLAETLLFISEHRPSQSHVLGIHLQLEADQRQELFTAAASQF